MNTLGIAVIGCGGIAKLHRSLLGQMQGVEIRAVCDVREERAQQAAQECNCEAYTDYRELYKRTDIDVVHICTPHHLHAAMAIDALNAGRYVLCEKPMASEVQDALRMIQADADHRLGIIFQNRYNASSVMMKSYVQEKKLGELTALRAMVAWHRDAAYYTESGWRGALATEGGGVMINQAIHTLDMMLWLGGAVERVSGAVSTDVLDGVIEVEDGAHCALRFADGKTGIFYATTAHSYDAPIELELTFERGSLLARGDTLLQRRGDTQEPLHLAGDIITGEKDYWGNGHAALFADFYACLREGRPFPIDGSAGLPALLALKSLYRSSQQRRPVYIKEEWA